MVGRREAWKFDTPFVSTDYRRTSRNNRVLVGFVSLAGLAVFFFCLFLPDNSDSSALLQTHYVNYNSTYPLTKPRTEGKSTIYKIGVIADPDKSSRRDGKDTYYSEILYGHLTFNENDESAKISFESNPVSVKSGYSLSGRGMELSDLIVFDGNILTVDDRTGIVFKVVGKDIVPWNILSDGDGLSTKGFKGEWMTVKDKVLIVGGMGKEYTMPDGSIAHHNPEYIKQISHLGGVEHKSWKANYDAIRLAAGYPYPSYLLHESCNWSEYHQQWFFLPRRASKEPYDEVLDENRCGNILIRADDKFNDITVTTIGELNRSRGYSAFRFIPNTKDKFIIATKTEEDPNTKRMKSYITVFHVDGKIVLNDQLIGENKYEGIEFL